MVHQVFRNHGFPNARTAHEDDVGAFGQKVEGKNLFNLAAINILGPGPIEVGRSLLCRQTPNRPSNLELAFS
jgi:hypothetical protein